MIRTEQERRKKVTTSVIDNKSEVNGIWKRKKERKLKRSNKSARVKWSKKNTNKEDEDKEEIKKKKTEQTAAEQTLRNKTENEKHEVNERLVNKRKDLVD